MKYVWFNINTGEFTNSFTEEERKSYLNEIDLATAKETGWKLIKFECENDPDFTFYNAMKVVTNRKNPTPHDHK